MGLIMLVIGAAFWAELSQVAGLWKHPWLLGGDFTVIRFPNEKRRGCYFCLATSVLFIGLDYMILLIFH